MCRRLTVSSRLLIEYGGFLKDRIANVRTQPFRRMQIGPPSEETAEFAFKTRKPDISDLYVRLKLDQNVHVAFRSKIIPQYRSKKCQLADAVLPAKSGQLLG